MAGKTFGDFLKEQSKKINNGFCYSTWPYPCMITEALSHAKGFAAPLDDQVEIVKEETDISNDLHITIKPKKGSGVRKKMKITLWWMKRVRE